MSSKAAQTEKIRKVALERWVVVQEIDYTKKSNYVTLNRMDTTITPKSFIKIPLLVIM
jgi:hypothetical protein